MVWTELAEFAKANPTETLLISIAGTVLVWLYKEFKVMIARKQEDKLKTIQLKQRLFMKLELSIATVLHLKNEENRQQMHVLLGECAPYLTSAQRTLVRDYYKSFDRTLLHSLQALTENEVDKLSRQLEKVGQKEENGDWLNYIQKLYAPVWPILLFGVIVMYVLFIIMLMREGANSWIQFNIVLFGISIVVSVTIAFSIILFLFRNEMGKQGIKRWVAIVVCVFSPLLFFVFNRFDISIIVVVTQASMLAYWSFSKRPPQIIRP